MNVIQENNIKTLILHAGHGGRDTGAVWQGNIERDQNIWLVDRITQLLQAKGDIAVIVAPHNLDTHESIPWGNQQPAGSTLNGAVTIEIHRDSAPSLANNQEQAKKRLGVYHGDSSQSKEVAEQFRNIWIANGAVPQTWARSHRVSNPGSLYAITRPKNWSWLFEMAFVQGGWSNKEWLAEQGARAIYEVMTGKEYDSEPIPEPEPEIEVIETYNPSAGYYAKENISLYEIKTGEPIKEFEKGTNFAISKLVKYETETEGETYYVTKYSDANNIDNGFRSSELTTEDPNNPVEPPEEGDKVIEVDCEIRIKEKDSQIEELEESLDEAEVQYAKAADLLNQNSVTINGLQDQVENLATQNAELAVNQTNSSSKKPWQSKKFWATILGISATLAGQYLSADQINNITELVNVLAPMIPASVYVIVQGSIDKLNDSKKKND